MTARFRDLDEILHELQRLFGQVDAVLRVAVFEHTRQTRHGAADRHISVRAPNNVFCLLPEAAFLRTGVSLIPHGNAAPDPARPLERVAGAGKLPPINKHTDRRAGLGCTSCKIQPLCRPAGPRPLILGVAVKIGRRVAAHAGILLCGGFGFFRLCAATGRIRRICDDSVKCAGRKALQHGKTVSVDDLPSGLIAHGHPLPSFSVLVFVSVLVWAGLDIPRCEKYRPFLLQ